MDIKAIKDSKFLKDMNKNELKQLAQEIRSFIIENVSKSGGHLSSNLGDVELIMALHKSFDLDKDKLLFDVGHQAYTHKILTGRASQFDTLRKIDGLSGFLSSEESKYDVFESGHSSTSISTAMGMAIQRDNNKENYHIVSIIGDASIANGVAFEALNNISSQKNKVIIVLNDNDMAINQSVGAFAKSLSSVRSSASYAKFKNGFERLFKWAPGFVNFVNRCVHRLVLIFRSDNLFDNFKVSYLGPIDGHDFKALDKAFKKAKNYPNSILIHIKTKKGKGYEFAENDTNGKFHGIGPFNIETGEILKITPDNYKSFTNEVADIMYDILNENNNTYLISSAMAYCTSLTKCFDDFKDRCIDVGISEEHSIALANGIALNNGIPYVSLYSTFMQRGYDQIVHDVARINSNITFLVDRAGIVGEDGKTHQGVLDVSFTYPLENVVITMPSEIKYVRPLFNCLKDIHKVKFIRYQKLDSKIDTYDKEIEFGKFIYELYNPNNKVSIIAVGNSVVKLKELIIKEKLPYNLFNAIFLKPIDESTLSLISKTKIYVYDNTSVYEGFTSNVVSFYNNSNVKVKYFTIKDNFIKHGGYDDILKFLSLDEESILKYIKDDNK